MVPGLYLRYHILVSPVRVAGKRVHLAKSLTSPPFLAILNVVKYSIEPVFPSYFALVQHGEILD